MTRCGCLVNGHRYAAATDMENDKRELIDLMVRSEVLKFGDFTTKSGRRTPYFIDAGRYRSGSQIAQLGELYARAIRAQLGRDFDVLFGPAYKGIPLAVATAIALQRHGHEVGFCFNRKEAKDHGEGGVLVGHELRDGDRVVIVEDVTTAGTSIRETVPLLRAKAKIELAALIVSVDRLERGTGEHGALRDLSQTYGMKTFAMLTIDEIIDDLRGRAVDGRMVLDAELETRLAAYRAQYGVLR
jgi:orotate phosphoribosyltransferase